MQCFEKFQMECAKHSTCQPEDGCPYAEMSQAEVDALPGEPQMTELDILLEGEDGSLVGEPARAFRPKRYPFPKDREMLGQQRTELAYFDIDVGALHYVDGVTYYTEQQSSWKDGIVLKFPRGIPERGSPCIAILKYDYRLQYSHFRKGVPRTVGRGMPDSLGEFENGNRFYGLRAVVRVIPATREGDMAAAGGKRLILVDWATRSTSRGGHSSGSLEDSAEGKIICSITGAESSAAGNHGKIWVCAVVEGNVLLRRTRISNMTCNVREFAEQV